MRGGEGERYNTQVRDSMMVPCVWHQRIRAIASTCSARITHKCTRERARRACCVCDFYDFVHATISILPARFQPPSRPSLDPTFSYHRVLVTLRRFRVLRTTIISLRRAINRLPSGRSVGRGDAAKASSNRDDCPSVCPYVRSRRSPRQ